MIKNKKILLMLAFSSLTTSYAAQNNLEIKYNNMYDKMTKNIDKGNSNSSYYKLIEKTLNDRNKELKDLYLQSDYIVKPEFLEWQVFFSAFYNNSHRGGEKENVTIRESTGEAKNIDLGMVIPINAITRDKINLNVTPISEPVINVNINPVIAPQLTAPTFTYTDISFPGTPMVSIPYFGIQNSYQGKSIGGYSANSNYSTSGNKIFENLNVDSTGGTSLVMDGKTNNIAVTGSASYANGAYTGTTAPAYTHTGYSDQFAAHNIGNNGNFEIKGNWNMTMVDGTTYNQWGFLSDRPYYATTNSNVLFSGNLNLQANNTTGSVRSTALIGMSLSLSSMNSNPTTTATMENSGTITIKDGTQSGQSAIAMQLERGSATNTQAGQLINSGNIIIESTSKNVQGVTGGVGVFVSITPIVKPVLIKPGKISVSGDGNRAVEVGSDVYGGSGYVNSNIIVDGSGGKITLQGSKNTGLYISRAATSTGNSIADNIKNMNILINGTNTPAISRETQSTSENVLDLKVNDTLLQSVEFGSNSLQSAIVNVSYGNAIIESSLANSLVPINAGKQNALFVGSYNTMIKNYMPINIGTGAEGMMGIVTNGSFENYADIVNNSSKYVYVYTSPWGTYTYNYGSIGLALNNYIVTNPLNGNVASTGLNTGNIDMNGEYTTGIYNVGLLIRSNNDHITAAGLNATGIYGAGNSAYINGSYQDVSSNTEIKTNRLEVTGDNGTAIFSKGGNISLGAYTPGGTTQVTVDGKDAFAFFFQKYYSTNLLGKLTLTSGVNTEIKNGGIAFYYEGTGYYNPPVSIPSYLTSIVDTTSGSLSVHTDQNSYNIAIRNAQVNLSDLSNMSALSGITFTGSGKSKVYGSKLIMDTDSNIDKNNTTGDKTYRNMEIGKSGVDINSGVTLSGTEDGLVGIGQSFLYNEGTVDNNNNGTINLSGNNSIGIYTKRGGITNNGLINTSGNSSTGIFTTAGYIYNNGEIKIGNQGIGIYSETYVDPSDNPYNYLFANVVNNGKITAGAGNKAIGIYAVENSLPGSGAYSYVGFGNGSDIDMSASKGGIGVYVTGSNTSSGGVSKITVGEDGTALYAKDGSTYLYDIELNLMGNNSVGLYLDNTDFYGTGTANVDGTGIVVINRVGNTNYDQNFNVNSTAGSQYILQNMSNSTMYYDSASVLGEGGTFVTGVNSAVLLDRNSYIVSSGSNMIGIALNGGYSGGLPVVINGETINQEAVNRGNISFGDSSTGIYVTNGASGENQGTITLGNNSEGLYGNGAGSSVSNTGSITIGGNSAGLYLKNGNDLSNNGSIFGTNDRTIGLYLDSSNTSTASNNGTIDLSGDKSIGIYAVGNGIQTLNNTGTIIVGDSAVQSDPSIGIYNNSDNNIINNSGNITSGVDSIGIYNKGGQINHLSGNITAKETGVGIYTDSGSVNLSSGTINLNDADTVGIYAINGATVDNNASLNVSDKSFGIVMESNSALVNRNTSVVGDHGIFTYSDSGKSITNELGADITLTGSKSLGFYMTNGGDLLNKAAITANAGDSNIGIYNKGGSIDNSGEIKIGDSVIVDPANPFANTYAVGLYGEDIQSMKNAGAVQVGAYAVGIYAKGAKTEILNTGNITSASDNAIGIYLEGSAGRNTGNITLSGENSIGIAAAKYSTIKNAGIITMNGDNSIGIYGNVNSTVINENTGKIYINGNDSTGVQLSGGSTLENYGLIEVKSGTIGSAQTVNGNPVFTPPSIINAGIIKVDEKFDLSGLNVIIKPDPASFRAPTMTEVTANGYELDDINAGFLLTNTVRIIAPSFNFGSTPIGIDPNFTQGTNARVYKFENVFDPTTPDGGPNTGEISVKSGSLTFDAIPVINASSKTDIWMEKINYDNFTQGAWYDGFAKNIEGKYLNAVGEALRLYDKLDLITDVNDLRSDFSQLAGSTYANINQREQNINEVFDNALDLLQNSENNTKENVKINIITGKGSSKEDTSGIESYDYNTYGVLALREVERTYRHKFGYSLGYTKTDFQMNGTDDEDQADTIQLGLHNKYSANGWNVKNDLLGRVSFHDVDRSVNWSGGTVTDLKSDYNVYGISSLNELGKELEISKNTKVTPYIGLELGYMMHPSFEEEGGAESLKIDSNDAYSIKPNVGVRLDGEKAFGATSSWKVKGNIGVGYEYELGNMNNQEKASLSVLEDGYHSLAKPAEDKGKIKTSGYAGVELKGAYGVYVTGEYGLGNDGQEDYKIGLSLKASF